MDSTLTNVKSSFNTTLMVLVFSALFAFFTSFFFKNKKILTVLKLEIEVCLVASIFYFILIQKVNSGTTVDWKGLTDLRYADWFFTTPVMLVSLAYFLSINSDTTVRVGMMSLIVVLNYIMLGFGYLGEVGNVPKIFATILGFIPFFILFYIIYTTYVKNSVVNHWMFGIYTVIWSLYGIVYLLPNEEKNLITNWLDLVSKGVIGLGTTGYFLVSSL